MESQVWKNISFSYPSHVPTMLSAEEKRYLYWLGESVWSGQGDILEIGPWLGGSTNCLALGMRASGHDPTQRLLVYDNFIWREFMSARTPLPLKPGDTFFEYFVANVQDVDSIVSVQIRALPDESIENDVEALSKRFVESANEASVPIFDGEGLQSPLEILFIDGAKSWRGMRHLMLAVNAHLVPQLCLALCETKSSLSLNPHWLRLAYHHLTKANYLPK